MKFTSILLASAALLGATLPVLHAQVTVGQIVGGYEWNVSGNSAVGEVFTAPGGTNELTSVEDWTLSNGGGGVADAYIYAWNSSSDSIGTLLWSSGSFSSFTVNTWSNLNIATTPGETLAFVLQEDPTSTNSFGVAYTYQSYASYAGMEMITGTNSSSSFSPYAGGNDNLNLVGTFATGASPVPEATSFIYAGIALCAGLAFWQQRRRAGPAAA